MQNKFKYSGNTAVRKLLNGPRVLRAHDTRGARLPIVNYWTTVGLSSAMFAQVLGKVASCHCGRRFCVPTISELLSVGNTIVFWTGNVVVMLFETSSVFVLLIVGASCLVVLAFREILWR